MFTIYKNVKSDDGWLMKVIDKTYNNYFLAY
jgi:hypothetical protein